eukprot:TRINITY_DN10788_c0_g1_i1.p1 TRINITY_DN10788_c0_g1~~TRINITY_DN10788_c0_g1_i1.p1  ORF type:complete len:398 (-),score=85.84 TRINITY_DN10788_c0_g1_i1:13-1206(-)
MSPVERIELAKKRLPLGSIFKVYVNSIENDRLFLTLATKPTPLLKFDYGGLITSKNVVREENSKKSWSSVVKTENSTKIHGNSKHRYLIIVDLEATCDFSPVPAVTPETAEIIEFPYVVLDTKTLEIVHEKQMYIKPENLKGITPYCHVLTSITQEVVSTGVFLGEAIRQMDQYLSKNFDENSFCIVTDGVWDLSCQLRSEAKRKEIGLAPWYQEYYNVREEFRKFLPFFPFSIREPTLHIMLQAMGLDFVGKHHRGIDDCHSIATLVKAMLIAGHSFENPMKIPEDYDQLKDPSFFTFAAHAPENSWKCQFCTQKFWDHFCENDNFRAVWNKPLASSCRFCFKSRPVSDVQQCQICSQNFSLSEEEIEYYQSRRWYFPKNCANCRQLKSQIFIGDP